MVQFPGDARIRCDNYEVCDTKVIDNINKNMYNQRPNSLHGLEPTSNGNIMNHLFSPTIYSPNEYFRNYLIEFQQQQVALASPLIQKSIQQGIQDNKPLQQQIQQQQQQQNQQQEPLPGPQVQAQVPPAPASTQAQATVQNPALPTTPATPASSDEEKLRQKRERNRRAAANCRRRKDEKLRQLEEENERLRKIIENLQETLNLKSR